MRIAIVYDCLYPHTVGGAERWLRGLAEALCEEHEVTYVTRRQWPVGESPLPGVRCVGVAPGGPLYSADGDRRVWPGLRFGVGVFAHLARRRGVYDVVHCGAYPFFGVLAVRAACAGRGTPRIFVDWAECLDAAYWRRYAGPIAGRAGYALQTLCVWLTPAAFCFSRLVERRLRRSALRGPVVRLPGLVAQEDRTVPPATAPRAPLVLFAGRHVPDKRTRLIADAVALAREQLPALRAVFVGDGPERPALLERIRGDAAMTAPGFVDERELARLMRSAACLVCASRREGYGMVVAEAAAAGTPSVVIAAPESAAAELVEEGVNGRVVADAGPTALAAAIVAVVQAGETLRRSTARWFERHREELTMAGSIAVVQQAYRRERASLPDAAVVLVNFRTPVLAKRCAFAARSAAAVGQVLVIDNASGDGSTAALRAAGLQVCERARNDGFAAAVNTGFAATSAPVVIVLNADVEPDPGALDRLVAHLHDDPRVGVAVPRLRFPSGEPQPNGYRRFPGLATMFVELCAPLGYLFDHLPGLHPYRAPAGRRSLAHASGAALAIRRAAYEDAGSFDERYFMYLEETEWQQRVRRRGWRIERVPGAEIVHHVRGGDGAQAPPPQFVASARRYLVAHGHSPRSAVAVLSGAILCSRLGLRALAALVPGRREALQRRARAYDRLWIATRGR